VHGLWEQHHKFFIVSEQNVTLEETVERSARVVSMQLAPKFVKGYWLGLAVDQFKVGGGSLGTFADIVQRAKAISEPFRDEVWELLKNLSGGTIREGAQLRGSEPVPGYPDSYKTLEVEVARIVTANMDDVVRVGYAVGLQLHRLVVLYLEDPIPIEAFAPMAVDVADFIEEAFEVLGLNPGLATNVRENLAVLCRTPRSEPGRQYLALLVNYLSNVTRDVDLEMFLTNGRLDDPPYQSGIADRYGALPFDESAQMRGVFAEQAATVPPDGEPDAGAGSHTD